MQRTRAFRTREKGQAVVLLALLLMALLGIVGLAVDAGQLYSAKRTEQEAADAGAFAGAVVLYQRGSAGQAVVAATTDVTKNGFANGADGTSVSVYSPPQTGAYAGNSNYVEVVITRQVHTTLVPAEGGLTTVRARGVAGSEPLNNGYAIMVLDRNNTPSAYYDASNADIHLHGGGILVNSTSSTAATNYQNDANRFTIDAPYDVDIKGGSATSWPVPITTGHPQLPDPFAGVPPPDPTGMSVYTSMPAGATVTINPGVYTVPITAAGNSTLYLNPGIYILEAGWSFSGNGNIQSNGGVFIYNTMNTYGTTSYPTSGSCSDLALAGNGTINLQPIALDPNAPSPYANLLIYQDKYCSNTVSISGNGVFTGSGTVYVPNGPFVFDGNNATLTGSQLVAKTVNVQNGNINITYSSNSTAQPILPRLVE